MTFAKGPHYRYVRRRWHVLFRMLDAIGSTLVRFLGGNCSKPSPKSPRDVGRVLLIQLDHLGDAVMTTSILPALRRHYRRAAIDVLAAPWNADVFVGRPEINRIFVSRWNRFQRGRSWLWPISVLHWARQLRSRRYDVALDVRGDFTIALTMALAGIERRVGWPAAGGGFLLTDEVPYVAGRHEVASRHAVLAALDCKTARIEAPTMTATPEAERFVARMLGDFRRGQRPLLVLHVGAGTSAKTWPVEHWRELIGRAIVELDANVVLVGGRSDVTTAAAITQSQFWPNLMDWTGRLSIDQLAAVTRRSGAFVGADSGPAHVAAAAGAEVVVLFSGSTDPEQWRPWGERVRVLRHAVPCAPCHHRACPLVGHPCMSELTPSAVIDALSGLFDMPVVLPMTRGPQRIARPGETA